MNDKTSCLSDMEKNDQQHSGQDLPALVCSPAVERIVKAWTDAGRAPAYHFACQQQLRDTWPVLAWAIEALVEENSGGVSRPDER